MPARHDNNGNGQGLLFEIPAIQPSDRIAATPGKRTMANGTGTLALSIETLIATVETLVQRVAAAECVLGELCGSIASQPIVKEFYSTQEAAKLLGKRPYTVREWCRLGRVQSRENSCRPRPGRRVANFTRRIDENPERRPAPHGEVVGSSPTPPVAEVMQGRMKQSRLGPDGSHCSY